MEFWEVCEKCAWLRMVLEDYPTLLEKNPDSPELRIAEFIVNNCNYNENINKNDNDEIENIVNNIKSKENIKMEYTCKYIEEISNYDGCNDCNFCLA